MLAEAVHVTGSLTRNVQTSRQSTPSMIDTHQTGLQTAKYTMDAPKHTKANAIAPIFTLTAALGSHATLGGWGQTVSIWSATTGTGPTIAQSKMRTEE